MVYKSGYTPGATYPKMFMLKLSRPLLELSINIFHAVVRVLLLLMHSVDSFI